MTPGLTFVDESSFTYSPLATKTPQPALQVKQQQLYSDTPSASSMASPKLQEASLESDGSSSVNSPSPASSPATSVSSPASFSVASPSLSLPSPGNHFNSPSIKSPRPASSNSTPGKSPLRSCHTQGHGGNNNNDAVFQLRRLTTATFPTSPQVKIIIIY